jgi:hypothetical protein
LLPVVNARSEKKRTAVLVVSRMVFSFEGTL